MASGHRASERSPSVPHPGPSLSGVGSLTHHAWNLLWSPVNSRCHCHVVQAPRPRKGTGAHTWPALPGAPPQGSKAPLPTAGAAGATHLWSRWVALNETRRDTRARRRQPAAEALIAKRYRTAQGQHLLPRPAAESGVGEASARGCAVQAVPARRALRFPLRQGSLCRPGGNPGRPLLWISGLHAFRALGIPSSGPVRWMGFHCPV